MRILYIHPGVFPPELYAGTELAMHSLCVALAEAGHDVVVVCLTEAPLGPVVKAEPLAGYRIVRSGWVISAAKAAFEQVKPEVVMMSRTGDWTHLLDPFIDDVPMIVYEHEIADTTGDVRPAIKAKARYIANSPATASHLKECFGIDSVVIPPLFGVDRYADIRASGDQVLFVSLQYRKGSDVAMALAKARPEAKFTFVESWTQDPDFTSRARLEVASLANVTLLPNQPGMRLILPQIKLLLMPSRGRESWGRTVTEAQLCGIPVLGSSRGNLVRTIGPGGLTLDPDDPIEDWLAAFDRIMDDPAYHAELSAKALAHATRLRDELARGYRTFDAVLAEVVAKARA